MNLGFSPLSNAGIPLCTGDPGGASFKAWDGENGFFLASEVAHKVGVVQVAPSVALDVIRS